MASAREYRLDDFEFHETIGTGGFSRVLLARNVLEGEWRAVKVVKKADVINYGLKTFLSRELELLGNLQHPCIVPLLGRILDSTRLYMIFELLSGGDLHWRMRDGALPAAEAKFYVGQIILGLAHLHNNFVLYRGLKPENVAIDQHGYVKLVDLGLSKWLQNAAARTLTMCGDPEYVAPEVLLRRGYGREVDSWALGVLVFELLSGHPPFCDETPLGVYRLVAKAEYAVTAAVAEAGASAFIAHLLVKDPASRGNPATAKAHPWLGDVRFETLMDRTAEPPYVPSGRRNFASFVEEDRSRTALMMDESASASDSDRLDTLFALLPPPGSDSSSSELLETRSRRKSRPR